MIRSIDVMRNFVNSAPKDGTPTICPILTNKAGTKDLSATRAMLAHAVVKSGLGIVYQSRMLDGNLYVWFFGDQSSVELSNEDMQKIKSITVGDLIESNNQDVTQVLFSIITNKNYAVNEKNYKLLMSLIKQ